MGSVEVSVWIATAVSVVGGLVAVLNADSSRKSMETAAKTEERMQEMQPLQRRHDESQTMASILGLLAPTSTDHSPPLSGEIARRKLSLLFAADFVCETASLGVTADERAGKTVQWLLDIVWDIAADDQTPPDLRKAARTALDRQRRLCPLPLFNEIADAGTRPEGAAPPPTTTPGVTDAGPQRPTLATLAYDVRIICSPKQKGAATAALEQLRARLPEPSRDVPFNFFPYIYNECQAVVPSRQPTTMELRYFTSADRDAAAYLGEYVPPNRKATPRFLEDDSKLPASHYLELWLPADD
jgi:hypothetical protein